MEEFNFLFYIRHIIIPVILSFYRKHTGEFLSFQFGKYIRPFIDTGPGYYIFCICFTKLFYIFKMSADNMTF